MYDDLARSQHRTPLERLVLHAVLPSVVLTLVLQLFQTACIGPPPMQLRERISYEVLPITAPGSPALAPVLVSIRRPDWPAALRQSTTEGRVVLRATIDERGRVQRSSIEVLQTTDARFDAAARQALRSAVFWPATWLGQNVSAPVTMAIDFNLYPG